MEKDEQNEQGKVQVGLRMESDLFDVITNLAAKEDRTVSNMIHRLLKQNPQVQEAFVAETAGAGA
ncbi:MAG TPA: hypothetical protein VJL58_10245 [Pyrinomonadaceae bacterium]|nr:hypothetical protein [Pyrinomonadaceae bacterium]